MINGCSITFTLFVIDIEENRKVSPLHYHRVFRKNLSNTNNKEKPKKAKKKKKNRQKNKQTKTENKVVMQTNKTVGHQVDVTLIVRMQLSNSKRPKKSRPEGT